jgi:hypothetical protein
MTPARERSEPRSVFTIKVEGRPGLAGVRQLRWLIKRIGRDYGLRIVDLREAEKPAYSRHISRVRR